jgi:hypothetical protein
VPGQDLVDEFLNAHIEHTLVVDPRRFLDRLVASDFKHDA